MELNNKGQQYEVIRRFHITEKDKGEIEYCVVKFLTTKNKQVVPHEQVKTGDFVDDSLLTDIGANGRIHAETITASEILQANTISDDDFSRIVDMINDSRQEIVVDKKIDLTGVVHQSTVEIDEESITTSVNSSDGFESEIKTTADSLTISTNQINLNNIVAINPRGKEIEVEDLETFCIENKLDIEIVKDVLDGKQKTHRKWRFKTV